MSTWVEAFQFQEGIILKSLNFSQPVLKSHISNDIVCIFLADWKLIRPFEQKMWSRFRSKIEKAYFHTNCLTPNSVFMEKQSSYQP